MLLFAASLLKAGDHGRSWRRYHFKRLCYTVLGLLLIASIAGNTFLALLKTLLKWLFFSCATTVCYIQQQL